MKRSEFIKAYKFVSAWLWDCREYGSERRTSGREWDNERCADVADMLKDYTRELQAKVRELERSESLALKTVQGHADKIVEQQAKIKELEEQVQREQAYQKEWADQSREVQANVEELRVAPVDTGITELDAFCQQFNDGEFDLTDLVCRIWNNQQSKIDKLEQAIKGQYSVNHQLHFHNEALQVKIKELE